MPDVEGRASQGEKLPGLVIRGGSKIPAGSKRRLLRRSPILGSGKPVQPETKGGTLGEAPTRACTVPRIVLQLPPRRTVTRKELTFPTQGFTAIRMSTRPSCPLAFWLP